MLNEKCQAKKTNTICSHLYVEAKQLISKQVIEERLPEKDVREAEMQRLVDMGAQLDRRNNLQCSIAQ
jgi:hypothetical protein